ncbi:hypothetical protein FRACYDRAFT_247732 [Fragilariopsis cylindrus CCMP1102]|uniref:Uncharacterized protein n=1 Tax=Fragilariopsis cylindrus CCMP1102 TaxID=635003 RepID=A0A1E7EVS5_9STRA|nr:hypothetical protein FRACYDRAFT_247732 [Fragilariopsis cylindrus CCMP1102]|eukprot:OEU10118.1 hypothetical protein FRACYDRAFT_247732 [Fragilariopsis cylindrus CCMP1102]
MGDCRIRIVIAKSLLLSDEISRITAADQDGGDGDHNVSSSNDTSVSFVYMYAADTTIREVTEGNFILRNIFFDSSKEIIANDDDGCSRKLFTLWDCTYHPPKDITSWPKYDFPDFQGMKSKTLHTAGMFPSGTWIVVPKGITPNKLLSDNNAYVDMQYNNVNTNNKNIGSSDGSEKAMKVMESVINRFQPENKEEFKKKLSESDIIALRRNNLQHRKRRERERVTKLDRKIEILKEQSSSSSSESCSSSKKKKTKKVSDQVLRMLVKSRATGEKSLKQQDRIYFQCLVFLDDDNENDNDNDNDNETTSMTNNNNINNNNNNNSIGGVDTAPSTTKESILSKEYRYFSPQDTFAKIANSFPNHNGYLSEVLCRRQPAAGDRLVADEASSLLTHRCFPVSMRIYEAISQGYLSDNDTKIGTLIIRWYRNRDNATPSIIENKFDDDEMIDTDESNNNYIGTTTSTLSDEQIMTDATTITTPETKIPMQVDEETKSVAINDTSAFFEDTQISNIIQKLDDLNRKGKKATTKNPLSAVAIKLRQMKSKGNKKIKIEDRIFLNVVIITFENTEEDYAMAISEDIFMSKSEPIERILRYISTTTEKNSTTTTTRNVEDWIFLVPQQNDSSSQHYREITTTSICIQEAEEFLYGKVSPFDRLIIRRKNS